MAYIPAVRFEWDPTKEALNRRKHGISFGEAASVFADGSHWLDMHDDAHSGDEVRYRAIGVIARGVLVVVYTEHEGDALRIISARRATTRERHLYEAWIRRNR
jgi:uncharacterized DUF497 family protein